MRSSVQTIRISDHEGVQRHFTIRAAGSGPPVSGPPVSGPPVTERGLALSFVITAGGVTPSGQLLRPSELSLVPGGQDDLGHQVGALSELLRYLLRPEPLLVVEEGQLLL